MLQRDMNGWIVEVRHYYLQVLTKAYVESKVAKDHRRTLPRQQHIAPAIDHDDPEKSGTAIHHQVIQRLFGATKKATASSCCRIA